MTSPPTITVRVARMHAATTAEPPSEAMGTFAATACPPPLPPVRGNPGHQTCPPSRQSRQGAPWYRYQ
jgi:hypothetical protein